MNKALKWILIAVGALIGLIIIVTLCLPLFIDPNDYKDKISKAVQEQTGRDLSMPGDINLDVSLIGLKTVFSLGDVNLSSSKDFPDTQFLSSKLVEINLALWPLIKNKELKVNKILLEGVNVNLVRNEEGLTNWDDLAGGGKGAEPPEEPVEPQPQQPKEKGKGLAGIDVGGIQANNINVTFTDKQVGRTVKLSNFNLDIGHLREGQSFPFKANCEILIDDGKLPPITASIDTSSNFTVYLADQHFVVDGFTFKGLLQGDLIPNKKLDLELSADIDANLSSQKVEIKKLAVKQGGMQIVTALSLANLANPQISGTFNIPEFSPRAQAESLGFPLPLEDPKSMTSMSAGIDFSMDMTQVQLDKINVNLDSTSINGTASIKDFLQPAYDLTLHINELDVDRYKMKKSAKPDEEVSPPAGGEATAPQTPQQETAGKDQEIIPVELLRGLNFNADLKIDTFKAAKMNISNIVVKASGKDGLVKLEPFAADLYEGSIKATADIDARPDIPEMKVVKDLKGVQLGPMTLDMTGKEEMKGKADIHVDVTTKGQTQYNLKRNANGSMSLSLADGEIAKLKIIDTIRVAKAMLGGDGSGAAAKDSGKPTTFASLTATGVITNGVFTNNDLLAESELMKVEGKGTVDLADELIDYLLTIHLADRLERDQESGLVNLGDTPIPYRIKGTFSKIEQSAALEELAKSQAKDVLFKEIGKQLGGEEKGAEGAEDKSSGGAEDLINKGLKSLFGN